MAQISEKEFEKILRGIKRDRSSILKHNPIGDEQETLLWMLMSVLISYLSIGDQETPCFPGKPTAESYRQAINFILDGRKSPDFDETPYLKEL